MANKISMSEEQARKFMEEQGLTPPKSKKKSKSNTNNKPSPTSSKGQGWWNEPIKHSLASQGIQTVFTGKTQFDDYGSVYHPSSEFKKEFKSFIKSIKNDRLREILIEGYKNPDELKNLDDNIEQWLENELSSIMYKKESQSKRNQLVDGNFIITEDEYKKLKDINSKLIEDEKNAEMWVKDIGIDIKTERKEAEEELKKYARKAKDKTSKPQKFRMKVHEKMNILTEDLKQKKADKKYGEEILQSIKKSRKKVEELFNKSMKGD